MSDEQRHFRGQACVICGMHDPEQREQQKVAGLHVFLCRKCHQALAERTRPSAAPIWTPPDTLESIARALIAEADLLSLMAQSRWLLAHALIDRVKADAPADPREAQSDTVPTSEPEQEGS